jgi:hypothetical protein
VYQCTAHEQGEHAREQAWGRIGESEDLHTAAGPIPRSLADEFIRFPQLPVMVSGLVRNPISPLHLMRCMSAVVLIDRQIVRQFV